MQHSELSRLHSVRLNQLTEVWRRSNLALETARRTLAEAIDNLNRADALLVQALGEYESFCSETGQELPVQHRMLSEVFFDDEGALKPLDRRWEVA